VPQPIKVGLQNLAQIAARVRDYADQLPAGHVSSLATAGSAQSGLVGRSARAIASTTQRWQTTTSELHGVLRSHAVALASVAAAYAQTEENNRDMIASLDSATL
jgi:WXG100 family type VII secretion target